MTRTLPALCSGNGLLHLHRSSTRIRVALDGVSLSDAATFTMVLPCMGWSAHRRHPLPRYVQTGHGSWTLRLCGAYATAQIGQDTSKRIYR